jgi:NAD(P)-dependent dehydrogenase (short-subunit alcohol dehydrogenase family)
MKYDGKTVLVTGASRGIGLAIAAMLGENGARHVIVNSSNAANTNSAIEDLMKAGVPAIAAPFDVFSPDAVA